MENRSLQEEESANLRISSRINKGIPKKGMSDYVLEKRENFSRNVGVPRVPASENGENAEGGDENVDGEKEDSIISGLFRFGDPPSQRDVRSERISLPAKSRQNKMTKSSTKSRNAHLRLVAEMELAEANKILAEKRLQLRILELEEETDISENSSTCQVTEEEIFRSNKNYVESWLKKMPEKEVLKIEEENEYLEEKALSCKSCCASKGENSQVKAIESLVASFTQAIEKLSEKAPQDSSHKIIARQAMGRDLPSFSGNPEEWPQFISEYKRTTKDCGFTNIENMLRLRKCLHGEAKHVVHSMLMVPENVDLVIDALESQFGKPEYIVRVLIDKVHKTPSPRKEKLTSFIQYATVVRNLVTTMQVLGENGHMKNPQLMSDMIEKLPNQQKLEWGRFVIEKCNKLATLLDFSNWLNDLSEVIRTVSCFKISEDNKSNKHDNRHQMKFPRENIFAVSENEEKEVQCCEFCQMTNHTLEKCWKFAKANSETKKNFVKEKRLCFSCLSPKHRFNQCKDKKNCGVDKCTMMHHPFLHENRKQEDAVEEVNVIQSEDLSSKVLLKILPVTLIGPAGEIPTYAFLDGGSTITTIHATLAKKLGLEGKLDPLCTRWTNGMKHVNSESRRVSLQIKGENGEIFDLNNVRTDKDLDLTVQSVNVKKLSKYWSHLKNVNVSSLQKAKPLILIGQDNNELLRPRSCISGGNNAPDITRTSLGWVIHGNSSSLLRSIIDENFSFHVHHQDAEWEELHKMVKESFSTETFGIMANATRLRSKEDLRAESILNSTTKKIQGRWETGLLWRADEVEMPKSKFNAFHRLKIMEKKMDADPNFAKQYCTKIADYGQKDYARKLTKEESLIENCRTYYLPHFGVFHPKKPGKLRFVFDAAAKSGGSSLNDKLLQGPDLLQSLVAVLFKFRQRKIAFTADIKEMYHQVRIREEDQNSQRFLWREMDRTCEPDVYVMQAMTFGSTSSPCSAQYVKNKNAMEFAEEYPGAAKAIVEKHYVDDYLDSCNDEKESIQLIQDVIKVHDKGGFLICNWISNSQEVLDSIPPDLRADGGKDIMESSLERVLGLFWNPAEDSFTFSTKFTKIDPTLLEKIRRPTKREILKIVMSVYDPLGFLAHFMVKAKILLQDVWRAEIGWDDEITESLNKKWISWMEKLSEIPSVRIPRCYSLRMAEATKIELHTFTDASERAFSAVSYLRITVGEQFEVAFVVAKTRVAPLRQMSIPRLELQGAVMGSRLAKTIVEDHELKIDERHFWTDSSTVLDWIRSDSRRYKPFVAHRISEILELTDVTSWHWLPTKENVADEATRDSSEVNFHKESRWFIGPSFLREEPSKWPKENEKKMKVDESFLELKAETTFVVIEERQNVSYLPDLSRFSSFSRAIRSTAWMLRFISNLKARYRKSGNFKHFELSPEEILHAEAVWWRRIQAECFPEEVKLLSNGKEIMKSSKLLQYSPFIDEEGIIRMNSRIERSQHANLEMKYPVILPQKHEFTRLMINHFHKMSRHQEKERVLNELQQRFVFPKMRSEVKKCWNECQLCKNAKSNPQVPMMGQLPKERLQAYVLPFTEVGMDFFGPMQVTIGRRREKRYGVIFTCLTTRAIHLELAASLSTDSCISAIRRFISRRGSPRQIISDNGTNLRGAEKEMKKAIQELNKDKIIAEMTFKEIAWKFNPPGAPFMGGSWERLIRSVKTAMRAILKEREPKEETLMTVLAEAEHIVNSRPLTDVTLERDDSEALTPNHFLLGSSSGNFVPGKFTDDDLCLRKQWKIAQRLADHFWMRWVKEYLPTLRKRTKWHSKTDPVKVGDVVIVVDNTMPRNFWPKGIIEEVFPGKDGQVRVVDVRTGFGLYRRPTSKIIVLDVKAHDGNEM